MTVSSAIARTVHVTHEAVTNYSFEFKVFNDNELSVVIVDSAFLVTTLLLGQDFSISGLGQDHGGTVSLTPAGRDKAGSGLDLVLLRQMSFVQETDYSPHDVFPAESHERALDILTMLCQELREQVGRAMIAPPNADEAVQYADFVNLRAAAEAARDAVLDEAGRAGSEADRAEAAADNAANEIRSELADLFSAAETAAGQAKAAKTQARYWSTLARKWAAQAEDLPVQGGLFSALHYAAKAAESAGLPGELFESLSQSGMTAANALGVDQSWQDFTKARVFNTNSRTPPGGRFVGSK